jgi:chromosome segregation ATPase
MCFSIPIYKAYVLYVNNGIENKCKVDFLSSQTEESLQNLILELQALDSKMRVVAQRMKIIEKNEQIIGKTLISHNKQIKELESSIGGGVVTPSGQQADLEQIRSLVDEFKKTSLDVSSMVESLKSEVKKNREAIDKVKEDFAEVKYVLDTINPAAYVTVEQVKEIIDDRLKGLRKKD